MAPGNGITKSTAPGPKPPGEEPPLQILPPARETNEKLKHLLNEAWDVPSFNLWRWKSHRYLLCFLQLGGLA
jgi:hypothetical protein